jgi:protocatechuate 3,4-dioxygenase beta subunit
VLGLGSTLAAQAPTAGRSATPHEAQQVTGRVLDEAGTPIAGACLLVSSLKTFDTTRALGAPTARSDAAGCFAVALPPRQASADPVLVLAVAPERAAVHVAVQLTFPPLDVPWPQEVHDAGDIVLPKATVLRGRVVTTKGSPVAGARVCSADALQGIAHRWPRWIATQIFTSQTTTDDNGTFTLPGVSPDGVRLRVAAHGFYDHEAPFVAPGGEPTVVLHKGGVVTGQVRNALGHRCAALLCVQYEHGDPAVVATAPDGRFELNLAHPARFALHALALHAAGVHTGLTYFGDGPVRDVNVYIGATPAEHTLRLRVADARDGRAIEDLTAAALWLEPGCEERWFFAARAITVRAPGEIELPGPLRQEPEQGVIMVRARGYAEGFKRVTWSPDVPIVVDLALQPEASIAGTVLDHAGQPVCGALVLVNPAQQGVWTAVHAAARGRLGHEQSDAAGRFRISGLGAGAHRLQARHRSLPDSPLARVQVAAASTTAEVVLALRPHFALRGKVIGSWPVGARVHVRPRALDAAQHDVGEIVLQTKEAVLGADGAFAVRGLAPGKHVVKLRWPVAYGRGGNFPVELGIVEVVDSDVEQTFDAAAAAPGCVQGQVTLAGDTVPMHRLVVRSRRETDKGDRFMTIPDHRVSAAFVGTDGAFALELPAGWHTFAVVDAGTNLPLLVRNVQVLPGKATTMDLEVTAVATRVVLRPVDDGVPVAGTRLEVDLGPADQDGLAGVMNGIGVGLRLGQREVDLFLPAQPLRLFVRVNALRDEHETVLPQPLAQQEFTPQPGSKNRVELPVAAPWPLPAGARRLVPDARK